MFDSWDWAASLEERKVVVGALLGLLVFGVVYLVTAVTTPSSTGGDAKEEEEETEPPRDFTPAQLRDFDGREEKIYVALKGTVFDVTSNPGMYGPEGNYKMFAGRDASRSLAKMSLDEADLDGPIDDLSASEVDALDEWHTTFKYVNSYPVVGHLTRPPTDLAFTRALLAKCVADRMPPAGRLHAPLLICVRGNVYDVSYGGTDHYGPDGPYFRFCGKDASRPLAKMSLDPADIDASQHNRDLSDLSEKEHKILDDWEALFQRKYPRVGVLLSEEEDD